MGDYKTLRPLGNVFYFVRMNTSGIAASKANVRIEVLKQKSKLEAITSKDKEISDLGSIKIVGKTEILTCAV